MQLLLKVFNHYHLGKIGERTAVTFLKEKGYSICELNFRYRKAEIDIIARKGGVLAIVEVKTRSQGHLGTIVETLSKPQRDRIVKATDFYVRSKHLEVEVRFDIITVLHSKGALFLEHFEDAYYYF